MYYFRFYGHARKKGSCRVRRSTRKETSEEPRPANQGEWGCVAWFLCSGKKTSKVYLRWTFDEQSSVRFIRWIHYAWRTLICIFYVGLIVVEIIFKKLIQKFILQLFTNYIKKVVVLLSLHLLLATTNGGLTVEYLWI